MVVAGVNTYRQLNEHGALTLKPFLLPLHLIRKKHLKHYGEPFTYTENNNKLFYYSLKLNCLTVM